MKTWLVILALLALLGAGAWYLMRDVDSESIEVREKTYGPVIEAAAQTHGVPKSWAYAFARHESDFKKGAKNDTGGDAKRGGAFGIFQVTLRTAKGLGDFYTADNLGGLVTNAGAAMQLIAQLRAKYGNDNLADVASAYNSGKPFDSAPNSTTSSYVPDVQKWEAYYRPRFEVA